MWVANKTATYRDPRYTCRNQLNIVLYVKNQKLTEDAGSLVNIIIWHVCRRYMKHWTAIYRESTRCVLGIWNCCTMWLMFAPLSHSICFGRVVSVDRDISRSQIPVLGSLKCGIICKNQELTEYVGGLANIISCAYLTSISEIWKPWTVIYRVHVMCVSDLELLHQIIVLSVACVCCRWVVNKTATYRNPRYTCRGSAKCCVIC